MKSLTLFKSIFDNKTNKRMDMEDWTVFEKFIFDLSEYPRKDKKSAQLISPAIYKDDTTRANDNVIGWAGWCAVDVDDYKFENGYMNLEKELLDRYGLYNHIIYRK